MTKVYVLQWEDQEDTHYPIGIFSSLVRAQIERDKQDAFAVEARKKYLYNFPYRSYWQIHSYILNKVEE